MSNKFHINSDGVPAPCHAKEGNCPFGGDSGEDNHYDSPEEAQAAADEINKNKFGLFVENIDNEKINSKALNRIDEDFSGPGKPVRVEIKPNEYTGSTDDFISEVESNGDYHAEETFDGRVSVTEIKQDNQEYTNQKEPENSHEMMYQVRDWAGDNHVDNHSANEDEVKLKYDDGSEFSIVAEPDIGGQKTIRVNSSGPAGSTSNSFKTVDEAKSNIDKIRKQSKQSK